MIFNREIGDRFETVSDAFLDLLKTARFHDNTGKVMSVDNLWKRTWDETERAPN